MWNSFRDVIKLFEYTWTRSSSSWRWRRWWWVYQSQFPGLVFFLRLLPPKSYLGGHNSLSFCYQCTFCAGTISPTAVTLMSLNNKIIVFITHSYFRQNNNIRCYLKIEPLKSTNERISRMCNTYTTTVIKYMGLIKFQ